MQPLASNSYSQWINGGEKNQKKKKKTPNQSKYFLKINSTIK